MPTSQNREAVAAKVRAAAAEKRISIRALADKTGIGYSALVRRMRGEVDFAAPELMVIADALGVSAGALLPEPVIERVAA